MSHEEPQVRGEEGGGTEEEEGDLEARTAVEALLALTSPMDYTQHPGEHCILPHACTKHHANLLTLHVPKLMQTQACTLLFTCTIIYMHIDYTWPCVYIYILA